VVFLNGSEFVKGFYRLFISLLTLEVQLSSNYRPIFKRPIQTTSQGHDIKCLEFGDCIPLQYIHLSLHIILLFYVSVSIPVSKSSPGYLKELYICLIWWSFHLLHKLTSYSTLSDPIAQHLMINHEKRTITNMTVLLLWQMQHFLYFLLQIIYILSIFIVLQTFCSFYLLYHIFAISLKYALHCSL
jgi:hypothetical protein